MRTLAQNTIELVGIDELRRAGGANQTVVLCAELTPLSGIAERHDVLVFADEVHDRPSIPPSKAPSDACAGHARDLPLRRASSGARTTPGIKKAE
jgi:bifunctional pyridoxal-dependent enzyme with beta-cystathionase and maltose regulon repressor activities